MGARPHRRGRVCGWHREQTFCSPADFLGDRRRRSCDLRHLPDVPPPEGEVLFSGMQKVVIHVPTPRVAHPLDVERGAGLADWLYQRRGKLDAHEACLAGDKPHRSRVREEAPPPINVGVVIIHGV